MIMLAVLASFVFGAIGAALLLDSRGVFDRNNEEDQ